MSDCDLPADCAIARLDALEYACDFLGFGDISHGETGNGCKGPGCESGSVHDTADASARAASSGDGTGCHEWTGSAWWAGSWRGESKSRATGDANGRAEDAL